MYDKYTLYCKQCVIAFYHQGPINRRKLMGLLNSRCRVCGAPLSTTLKFDPKMVRDKSEKDN
jgi:hypothetical protein